jgi:multiple sugar transport system permease protein
LFKNNLINIKIRKGYFQSFLFLLPVIVFAIIFFFIPFIKVVYMSFFKGAIFGESVFVSLDNYKILLEDAEFWQAMGNTLIYTVIVTPIIFIPAVFLAVLLNRKIKSVRFFRAVYFLPVTMSFVVASYIWKWMYNDIYGILNYLLRSLHIIDTPILFLGSTWLARFSVSNMIGWKTIGFNMLIILGGLQGIQQILYEAASVDGANQWQKFRFITLPLLRGTLVFALIISVSGSFKAFDHFYIMTGGGPARSTETIVMYIQKVGFEFFKLNYGAAISVIFLIILLIVNILQFWVGRFNE